MSNVLSKVDAISNNYEGIIQNLKDDIVKKDKWADDVMKDLMRYVKGEYDAKVKIEKLEKEISLIKAEREEKYVKMMPEGYGGGKGRQARKTAGLIQKVKDLQIDNDKLKAELRDKNEELKDKIFNLNSYHFHAEAIGKIMEFHRKPNILEIEMFVKELKEENKVYEARIEELQDQLLTSDSKLGESNCEKEKIMDDGVKLLKKTCNDIDNYKSIISELKDKLEQESYESERLVEKYNNDALNYQSIISDLEEKMKGLEDMKTIMERNNCETTEEFESLIEDYEEVYERREDGELLDYGDWIEDLHEQGKEICDKEDLQETKQMKEVMNILGKLVKDHTEGCLEFICSKQGTLMSNDRELQREKQLSYEKLLRIKCGGNKEDFEMNAEGNEYIDILVNSSNFTKEKVMKGVLDFLSEYVIGTYDRYVKYEKEKEVDIEELLSSYEDILDVVGKIEGWEVKFDGDYEDLETTIEEWGKYYYMNDKDRRIEGVWDSKFLRKEFVLETKEKLEEFRSKRKDNAVDLEADFEFLKTITQNPIVIDGVFKMDRGYGKVFQYDIESNTIVYLAEGK